MPCLLTSGLLPVAAGKLYPDIAIRLTGFVPARTISQKLFLHLYNAAIGPGFVKPAILNTK